MRKNTACGDELREHVLACLSSSPSNEKIVRTAAQMSRAFGGRFTALYVRTPEARGQSREDAARVERHIRLAESLGAEVVTTHGDDVALQIAEYARLSGATKLVLGSSSARRRHFWSRPTLTERLIEAAPDMEIFIIPDAGVYRLRHRPRANFAPWGAPAPRDCLFALLTLAACTLLGGLFQLLGVADDNIITIYLLGNLLIALRTRGYLCCAAASVLSVVLFEFWLIEPRMSFRSHTVGVPVTLGIMLAASLLTGTLAARLRAHARLSAQTAFRAQILFDTDRLLQRSREDAEILGIVCAQLGLLLRRDIVGYAEREGALGEGRLFPAEEGAADASLLSATERGAAEWAFQHRARAGATTERFPEARCLYLSIRAGGKAYGVVGIPIGAAPLDPFEQSVLLAMLGECALAMDNQRNAREKEASALLAKNEQLRANLLRAISHDLRTPLTSISGNADSLLANFDRLEDATRRRMLADILEDARWLTSLVENLLSITKLGDGSVRLNLSDQLPEDVVAEALRHVDRGSGAHAISTDFGGELFLVRMDARLIVQVLVNLVNNAIKHTPPGSKIEIRAVRQGRCARFSVLDDGPGIPDAQKARAFELFYTGDRKVSDGRRSMGIGLAVCRSAVEAHGGRLTLNDHPPHGCDFSFTLPLSEVNLNE